MEMEDARSGLNKRDEMYKKVNCLIRNSRDEPKMILIFELRLPEFRYLFKQIGVKL